MRISDWSSDVCSSDLLGLDLLRNPDAHEAAPWLGLEKRMSPGTAAVNVGAPGFELTPPAIWPALPSARDGPRPARRASDSGRSEERRVGKECVGKCSSRWWPYQSNKKVTEKLE